MHRPGAECCEVRRRRRSRARMGRLESVYGPGRGRVTCTEYWNAAEPGDHPRGRVDSAASVAMEVSVRVARKRSRWMPRSNREGRSIVFSGLCRTVLAFSLPALGGRHARSSMRGNLRAVIRTGTLRSTRSRPGCNEISAAGFTPILRPLEVTQTRGGRIRCHVLSSFEPAQTRGEACPAAGHAVRAG